MYVRPRMTQWYAFSQLNNQFRQLSSPSSGLFRVKTWESDDRPDVSNVPIP